MKGAMPPTKSNVFTQYVAIGFADHKQGTQAREPRRPPGWEPPGPRPSGPEPVVGEHEVLSFLVANWRILQRRDGHRWSLDDLVTAYVARSVIGSALGRPPASILDLGTGIGSVALILAWAFPDADITGVEAQAVSADLARRSVVMNGARARIVEQDFRTYAGPPVELVTGTPPYFDDPLQPRSDAVQRGPCRFEDRGSIADYLATGKAHVTTNGRVVVCHASRQRARVMEAITRSGLTLVHALEVVPRLAKEPLVDVFALASDAALARASVDFERLTVRDTHGEWTPEFLAVRLAMGMPPKPT